MSNLQFPSKAAKVESADGSGTFSPFWFNWLQQIQLLVNGLAGNIGGVIQNQSPNTVYAGPKATPAGAPAFRALVTADMPGVTGTVTIATAKLTGGGSNGSMTFVNGILTAHTDAT